MLCDADHSQCHTSGLQHMEEAQSKSCIRLSWLQCIAFRIRVVSHKCGWAVTATTGRRRQRIKRWKVRSKCMVQISLSLFQLFATQSEIPERKNMIYIIIFRFKDTSKIMKPEHFSNLYAVSKNRRLWSEEAVRVNWSIFSQLPTPVNVRPETRSETFSAQPSTRTSVSASGVSLYDNVNQPPVTGICPENRPHLFTDAVWRNRNAASCT